MNAVHLAEQATLGALLLHPVEVDRVAAWLRVGDFTHHWHRAVYATIRERRTAREPVDPVSVGHALLERLGPRRAELHRIHDLVRATPVRPNGARYAAMVLEGSLRRDTAGQGVLLRAAALSASLTQENATVVRMTGLVDSTLQACEKRWLRCHDPADAAVEPPTLVLSGRDAVLGADRLLRAHPPLDPVLATENEQRLIAALVARPAQAAAVAGWLRPESLTDADWRPVYAALVQLVELAQPVDVVMVAWEVRRASARAGAGPGTRALRDAVEVAAVDDPGYLARAVAGDQLRRTADQAADALYTAAANPGVDLTDLFATGHLMTAALREVASVLPDHHVDPRNTRHLVAVPNATRSFPAPAAGMIGPVAG